MHNQIQINIGLSKIHWPNIVSEEYMYMQQQMNTLMKSSDEYRYLSIWVSPLSTSHKSTKPREAVALNIPKTSKLLNDNCPHLIVFSHTIDCYWNLWNTEH